MKKYADVDMREVEYTLEELVYVKLQPYRQKSLASVYVCGKLVARLCGPFLIVERISKVAYCLEFPPSAQIHSIFHVLSLKRQWNVTCISNNTSSTIRCINFRGTACSIAGYSNRRCGTKANSGAHQVV